MAFAQLSVCREFSAERINRVCNDPDVRPWIGGAGVIDLSVMVADPHNILLMGEGGGVLFQWMEPGLYEAHTQFLASARGPAAIKAVEDALRWMFCRADAVEIVTKVPDGNKAALGLVRAIHGHLQFRRENAWAGQNGLEGVGYYSLSLMHWAGKAVAMAENGEWFHGKLEAAKAAQHATQPLHDDDDAHDQYVGATVEMIGFGQVGKGIAFYSRWAKFAGYGPIAVIAQNPLVIDIGDALLAVRGDDFSVLLCR